MRRVIETFGPELNICGTVVGREGGWKPVMPQLERLGQLELQDLEGPSDNRVHR